MSNKTLCLLLLLLILIFGRSNFSFAVPAAPDIFEIVQPDGSVFNARLKGDEWNNRVETIDGYSIKRGHDKYWYYISYYDKNIPVLSGTHAHHSPPAGLKKRIHPQPNFLRAPGKQSFSHPLRAPSTDTGASGAPDALGASSPSGTFNGTILFILAEFTDRSGTYPEASFATFINDNISDYFDKASYGNVILSPANESYGTANNGVVGWVNVGYNHPNTGGSTGFYNQKLTRDAIIAADPYIDYSSYDNNSDGYVDADELAVVVIAAGYERSYSANYTPNVWGHKWDLGWVGPPTVDGVIVGAYNGGSGGYAQFGEIHRSTSWNQHQATMGIMVHELGHLIFGLPDLYDTDGSSEGIGAFGIMGSGSWGKASSDAYPGETPVLPCAWSKHDRGWITVSTGSGTTSIIAAGSASATSADAAYKLPTGLSNEYFLVENRQPLGYDRGLERWFGTGFGGLAIWHIDENTIASKIASNSVNNSECYPGGPSCTSDHYGVALEQADGNWHLEKGTNRGNATDLWYLGNQSSFDSTSTPDSDLYNESPSFVSITNISASGSTMTATLSTDSTPPIPGAGTPSDTQYGSFVDSPFDLSTSFTDNESDITNCKYCASTDGTCDTEWTSATLSGSSPAWTCTVTGLTGSNGQLLTLNMRATSSGGTGTGTAVTRTVDSSSPITTDDSSSTWTSTSPVTVVLTSSDGTGSGIAETKYCIDGTNSCTPNTTGTSASISCSAGSECTQYVRYFSTDNVGNQEGTKSSNQIRQDLKVPTDGVLTATPGDGQVDHSWSGFSDNGSGLDATDTYKLVYLTTGFPSPDCTDGIEITSVTTQTNYSHTGLNNGTAYYYRICAFDAVGNISSGATANATPQAQYQLTTSVSPPSSGSVNPDCSGGCWYDSGTEVVLTATENNGYFFDNWTNCDSPSNNVCTETMDADDTVTANFQACPSPVRIAGPPPVYYSSLQDAYNVSINGDTIQSQAVVFIDNFNANRSISVTLEGGYDCNYTSNSGETTLNGNMTINNGTITIEGFILEQ